jgi:hypothetical protein
VSRVAFLEDATTSDDGILITQGGGNAQVFGKLLGNSANIKGPCSQIAEKVGVPDGI